VQQFAISVPCYRIRRCTSISEQPPRAEWIEATIAFIECSRMLTEVPRCSRSSWYSNHSKTMKLVVKSIPSRALCGGTISTIVYQNSSLGRQCSRSNVYCRSRQLRSSYSLSIVRHLHILHRPLSLPQCHMTLPAVGIKDAVADTESTTDYFRPWRLNYV